MQSELPYCFNLLKKGESKLHHRGWLLQRTMAFVMCWSLCCSYSKIQAMKFCLFHKFLALWTLKYDLLHIKLWQIFFLKYTTETEKRTSVLLPALDCIIFMSVSSSFRKFKIKCSIIRAGWWGDKISGYSYHEDNGQQDAGDEHHREAVNEPGQPVDAVTQAHHPHRLL